MVLVVPAFMALRSVAQDPAIGQSDRPPRELVFLPVKIDGPAHDPARHSYWFGPFAECASVLDIDGDGRLDIAAGRNYYLAPALARHSGFRDGAETNGADVDDNHEATMDVNGDGRTDVISSGWMLRKGIWWYENPGRTGSKWASHPIYESSGVEGMVVGNLSGNSSKDVLVNFYERRPGRSLIWFEHIDRAPWFEPHVLGPEGAGVMHGAGIGDVNGDGRNDVVTPSGWFESPPHPTRDRWIWHPDYQFSAYGDAGKPGGTGLPILVADVDGDGLNDLIMGSDHFYGLAWYRQSYRNGKRTFEPHWIETDYPTFHTMVLADLDGDGRPELITGKQLLAHNGRDMDAFTPVHIFYYKFDHGRFERHIISQSYVAPYFGPDSGNRLPPDNVIGLGMRFEVADMDADGRPDIVVACRTGLYIFYNKGYPIRVRQPSPMPDHSTYPSYRNWDNPAPRRPGPALDREGFRPLLIPDGGIDWSFAGGTLSWTGSAGPRYLWTQQVYSSFVLDFEFRVESNGDGGVFLRTTNTVEPEQNGIKIRIADPPLRGFLDRESVGGIFGLVSPRENAGRRGDWNRYTIACEGPRIEVALNGHLVSEIDLDAWTRAHQGPDGAPNRFDRPLKEFPRAGYIGFEARGGPVYYRNIRIKPAETDR